MLCDMHSVVQRLIDLLGIENGTTVSKSKVHRQVSVVVHRSGLSASLHLDHAFCLLVDAVESGNASVQQIRNSREEVM